MSSQKDINDYNKKDDIFERVRLELASGLEDEERAT